MNSVPQTLPLGLWELDAKGTVLHYEPAVGEPALQSSEVVGKDFVSHVLLANHFQGLRNQVELFVSDTVRAHSLDLIIHLERGDIRTRILLGRTTAKSGSSVILVHIRKASAQDDVAEEIKV